MLEHEYFEKTAANPVQAHVLIVLCLPLPYALPIMLLTKIILTLGQCQGWTGIISVTLGSQVL